MTAIRRSPWLMVVLFLTIPLLQLRAQEHLSPATSVLQDKIGSYRKAHSIDIIKEFEDLLSIPNVAANSSDTRKNAELILRMLGRRGIKGRLLLVDDAPPAVFAELNSPGASKTIAVYAHYDGQPVDPSLWTSDPWQLVLRDRPIEAGGKKIQDFSRLNEAGEFRLYARSAADDKAPIIAWLAALDALKALQVEPSVNVKFFFEGEEEAGSAHLATFFQRYENLLKADVWLLCDGPVHQTRRMQVYFGARGVQDLEMTVYGPDHALHSGHYGNWAPNPIALLANLISRMRDPQGNVLIPGFMDDVRQLTAAEKQAISEVPNIDKALLQEFGLAEAEMPNQPLVERLMMPALNLRGIESGHTGAKTTNAIPTEATASIDFRLVPDQTPAKIRLDVERFIAGQGYFVVHGPPSLEIRTQHPRVIWLKWGSGYPSARTAMDSVESQAILHSLQEASSQPIIKLPTLGGSVPMYLFTEKLHTAVIGIPIVNHDNNQHGPNENLRLQNLWDGIDYFAFILARSGRFWN